MRLETDDRSFFALLGVALVPYVVLFLLACGLVAAVTLSIANDGLGALTGPLGPAAAALSLVGIGTVMGVLSFRRQSGAGERLGRDVAAASLPLPDALEAAARTRALDGRVDFVDDDDAYSFAYGLSHPRVAVSRGLVERLDPEELDAVLTHEAYHVRSRDPLKIVITRSLAPAMFFLPVLRPLHHRYAIGRELAADRRAIRVSGTSALSGALLKVVGGPVLTDLSAAAAIGGPDLLDARVTQLETGAEPELPRPSRLAGWISAVALAALTGALVWTAVSIAGRGMSQMM